MNSKLNVGNIEGLSPNFTVKLKAEADMVFKGDSQLLMNQTSHLALPAVSDAQFDTSNQSYAPRRGYRNGQLRFNTSNGKLQIYNDGRWTSG